jgi:hypothetical protein
MHEFGEKKVVSKKFDFYLGVEIKVYESGMWNLFYLRNRN